MPTHTPPPANQATVLVVAITIANGQVTFSGSAGVVAPNGDLTLTGLPASVQIVMVILTGGWCFDNDGSSDSAVKALFLSDNPALKAQSTNPPAVFKKPQLNPLYFNVLTLTTKNKDNKTYHYTLNFIDSNSNLLSYDPIIFNN
jgi:hypothetical protein